MSLVMTTRPSRHRPHLALAESLLHGRDLRVGHGLAVFIEEAAGDHAAAREDEIHALADLARRQLDDARRVVRLPLSVAHADVAGVCGRDIEAAGGQLAKLVASVPRRSSSTSSLRR